MKLRYGLIGVFILTAFILSGLSASVAARIYDSQTDRQPILLQGRVQVQFESDVDQAKLSTAFNKVSFGIANLDRALERIEATDARRMFPWRNGQDALVGNDDMSKFYEIYISEDIDISSAIEELRQNPYVRSAEPVFAIPLDVTPNDPRYLDNDQWAVNKIDLPGAWNYEKGSDTAKIAIIDSGVRYTHTDLTDNIWVNPYEDLDNDQAVFDTDDLNAFDNDPVYDGLDDLIGYDFFNGFPPPLTCDAGAGEDCATPDSDPMDFGGHGSHVAGIAAGVTNNALGIAGSAGGWGGGSGAYRGARIMCIRVGGMATDGIGYVVTTYCATGIDYAVKKGADVINCSWGFPDPMQSYMNAPLLRADSAGVIVVHSAGNDGNTSHSPYDTWAPNGFKVLLVVAASGQTDYRSGYSNYGEWVDVCAPGDNILSAFGSGDYAYEYLWGTSMAAPYVTGLAALIKSHMPNYTRNDIVPLILDNADPMPDSYYAQGWLGSGRINASASLSGLPTAAFSAGPELIGEAPLTVDFVDESPNSPTSWTWDFGDGDDAFTQNPSHTYNDYGFKTVSLTVDEPNGTATEVLKNLVMVTADTVRFASLDVTPNSQVVVPVYMDNKFPVNRITLPFKIRGADNSVPGYINVDSLSVVGLRTEYFDQHDFAVEYPPGHIYKASLISNLTVGSDYLEPDTGAIMNLYITIGTPTANEALTIEDTTVVNDDPLLHSIINNYPPVVIHGGLVNCPRGDADSDGTINLLDATFIVNFLYKNGPEPYAVYCADADANGSLNILDVTYLINYLYKNGPPPPP
ncbi:MAG: S8 family serine peptidase [Candidatus Zixiibacteriota bacterium]|nr:MAG: S8 family serine peptidase [candidate division Zixibacteria bacterium]